jgi:Flp pilus assembly protein TadG
MSRVSAGKSERGVTLLIMAITIFLTLGMAALAIDYGMIKTAKAEAQRAMDSAALAGASAFQVSDPAVNKDSLAIARAKEFARKHTVYGRAITDAEVQVFPDADPGPDTVGVTWARPDLRLWFASMFGSTTMGLTAHATAQAAESGTATCLKPVGLPDMWNNLNNVTTAQGNGTQVEDRNGNHVWDAPDDNGNGIVDPGEMEPWTFNTGDVYDPPTTGYGTAFRDPYGSGYTAKTQDYGRQVLLQTFDQNADRLVSSYFRTWADNSQTRGVDSLAAGIRGDRCLEASVGVEYDQGNGAKNPLQLAWEDVINRDASAHWDDASNTVVGSSFGANWLSQSPRVVVVGLYPPSFANSPESNPIEFVNFGKIWIDQRPCSGADGLGNCKNPITARFLGYVEGGTGGPTTGSLIKNLVLIK